LAKYKVLVVDDDEAIRFAVQDYLEAHGLLLPEQAWPTGSGLETEHDQSCRNRYSW
jgi:CheY-like chemotaxis protein